MEKVHILPSLAAFNAVQSAETNLLKILNKDKIRCILPTLVRTLHYQSKNMNGKDFQNFQMEMYSKISMFKNVENLFEILKMDFKIVQDDVLNEQQLRQKMSGYEVNNLLSESTSGLLLEFERSNLIQKMRLVLSEILRVSSQVTKTFGITYNSYFLSTILSLSRL